MMSQITHAREVEMLETLRATKGATYTRVVSEAGVALAIVELLAYTSQLSKSLIRTLLDEHRERVISALSVARREGAEAVFGDTDREFIRDVQMIYNARISTLLTYVGGDHGA